MRKILFLFCLIFLLPALSHAAETRATVLLLDISKSVAPKDFRKAKATIREMIDQNRPPDILSVYVFGTKLKKIDPAQLDAMEATESYTMLYDAAYDAAQDLTELMADRKAILIFSDGFDTKSVTISEDIVSYARQQGIAIYGVGVGKANRKVLERMAKLTGGTFFSVEQKDLIVRINSAIANQTEVSKAATAKEQPIQVAKPVVQPSAAQPVAPTVRPTTKKTTISYSWIATILAATLLLAVVIFVMARSRREVRDCPTCGRRLESYQTICPDCTAETKITPAPKVQVRPDGTQEINPSGEEESIPKEWLEKSQATQEILTKTSLLVETPLLVVKKGKNRGKHYSLKQDAPLSIGRSRVNEIRLDDEAVSAQHCRIIPENGKHVLHDLGSTNGTFVNDANVSKAILNDGDTIKVGETQFLYKIQQRRS